ncbi:hypothetical protein K488DRAFT_90403 [Vararia minispora EC-137]|uniref:Uncharacterized protein n=1 Tax=Vararia minispora EC-137 TaxID=1314806 RepID=A0ACB8Q7R4_9AGAM|nr:hypothetical protein K488DRAFT_90403 [Vararia minispora EC-137]
MVDHLARARAISVTIVQRRHDDPDAVIAALDPVMFAGKCLPSLETLELTLSESHGALVTDGSFQLPAMLSPRLQSLRLTNFFVPFSAATLSHLHLYRQSRTHALPSPSQFFDILRSCSQLLTLDLRRWIPNGLTHASQPTVFLPCLRLFESWDREELCTILDSHLSLPADATTRFVMSPGHQPELIANFPFLERHFKARLDATTLGHHLVCTGHHSNQLQLDMHATDDVRGLQLPPQGSFYSLSRPLEPQALTSLLARIFSLCSGNLSSLMVYKLTALSKATWRAILPPLHNVRVVYTDDPTLLAALTVDANESSEPLLPALSELSVSMRAFNADLSVKDILRILLSRRRARAPVYKLAFYDVDTDEDEERLHAIIPHVKQLSRSDFPPRGFNPSAALAFGERSFVDLTGIARACRCRLLLAHALSYEGEHRDKVQKCWLVGARMIHQFDEQESDEETEDEDSD